MATRTPRFFVRRGMAVLAGLSVIAAGCSIPTTEEAIIADGGIPFSETSGTNQAPAIDRAAPEDQEDQSAAPGQIAPSNSPFDTGGLEYSGPGLSSHWHAAYAVRICDELLDPFTSTDDPLGIHSHGDGLIHIHPFFTEAAWGDATLGHFVDAMGFELEDGHLTIPGVGEWRDGDECDGVPARVSVQRWVRPDATEPWEEITESMTEARFLHDGEMFTISFAPQGRLPIRPSAAPALLEVSPSLREPNEVFVALPNNAESARLWTVAAITQPPCTAGEVAGLSAPPPQFCYTPGAFQLDSGNIVSAVPMWVNRGPGVVIELDDQAREQLNAIIAPHVDSGGIRMAVEVDDVVVLSIALLRPLGDSRLAFVGGMTVDQASTLASLLGSF